MSQEKSKIIDVENWFSPDFINQTFTLLGLVLFGLGFWHLVVNRKWIILTFLLIAPLSPLFDLPSSGFSQTIILYSMEILVMIFGLKNLWAFFFS